MEKWERKETAPLVVGGRDEFPAVTYSRPRRTTIGPGCLTAVFGMGTGGAIRVCSPGKFQCISWQRQSSPFLSSARPLFESSEPLWGAEGRINAAKRSAVSTGRLSALPHVHVRPIDLVVFQEPSLLKGAGDLVLRGVSRLDAFSVYPGRT